MIKERIGTEISLLGGRIKNGLNNQKESITELQSTAAESTRRAARRTDYFVHDNAWTMMGVAAGLAFAAGFFFSRRNQEGISAAVGANGSREVEEKVHRLNTWEFLHSSLPLALFLWKAVQASRCARKGMI